MNKQKKIIGILGGMGPQASAHLVKLLIDKSSKEFGAKNGDDFPEIILDSVPVFDSLEILARALPKRHYQEEGDRL